MNLNYRAAARGIAIVVASFVLPVAANCQNGTGQPAVTTSGKAVLEHYVDQLAASIQPGDTAGLGRLAEAVVGISLFNGAPATVAKRLAAAHILYQKGSTGPVSIGMLTDALNSLGQSVSLPPFTNLTPEQILNLRLRLLSTFPRLLGPLDQASAHPDFSHLAPMGAFLLADVALKQKLLNPEFQNEQWQPPSSTGSPSDPKLIVGPPPSAEGEPLFAVHRFDLSKRKAEVAPATNPWAAASS